MPPTVSEEPTASASGTAASTPPVDGAAPARTARGAAAGTAPGGADRGAGAPRAAASSSSAPVGGLLARCIATVTGNLFLVLGTIVFGLSAVVLGLVFRNGNVVYRVFRMWSKGLLLASGISLDCRFEQQFELDDRLIFMANHQSLFDIPVLIATLPVQTRFWAKKSLFKIPIFGWAIRQGGFIPIDREDRSSARASFAAAVECLQGGASMLSFPEETRSSNRTLLPFQRGGFLLARKSGLPIVPVGIDGTHEVQKKNSLWIQPGTVRVRYGAAIDLTEYKLRRKNELLEDVRNRVAELSGMAC